MTVPILNASGCLDALVAPQVARALDAFVTKTVTPLPREGNEPARIAESEVGMVNSIGLQNPGIDAFVTDYLPGLRELGVPLWVSVGGFRAGDYGDLCDILESVPGIATIELNLSCPNVEEAPESAGEIVEAARSRTTLPLYAKLSPAAADLPEVARAVEQAGADGLTLVNTIRGLVLDERTLRPVLARGVGGLSGPAIRPVALAAVYACRSVTDLPIVGVGGISTGRHALELVAAGANAVALGTSLFADPDAPSRVRTELADAARAAGLGTPGEGVGIAHERRWAPVATPN